MRMPEKSRFCLCCRLLSFLSLLVVISGSPAYPIDFITEEDYLTDRNEYKDYPLKILFKKLAEERGSERDRIRNYIILKQAFDKNARSKAEASGLKYKESFGIIREMNENGLTLWFPETDSFTDFYVGIEKVPVEKTGNYEITESNIENCASTVCTLDRRIYKIKIDFRLTAPENLEIRRKGDNNLVSWDAVSYEKKPFEYRVFTNGLPSGTVTGTSAILLRTKGRVDRYYVKAVYRKGDVRLESAASDVVEDEITAKELQKERLAEERYDRVVASLHREEYEQARRILYDSRPLFEAFLDPDRRENMETLVVIFKDIDEGDRLSMERPGTARNLGMALRFYQKAVQKGKDLPPEMDIRFITELKVKVSRDRKDLLQARNNENRAVETFYRILASLKPLEWEKGKRIFYENRTFLREFLDRDRRETMERLADFFQDIDKGDRRRSQAPETGESLSAALVFYKRAGEKAEVLSDKVDVAFIAEQRLKEGLDRKNLLEMESKKTIARERYNQILSRLKPGEWLQGKMLLIDNRQFITECLDDHRKENVERLVRFFQILEEGDRLSLIQPETEKGLEHALTIYKKAEQAARELDEDTDLTFITEQRIRSCVNRRALLEARESEPAAEEKPKISLKELSTKPMVEIVGDEEIPDEDFDRDTEILLALREFDEKKYQSSWDHFLKVFREQIHNIRLGGKSRVKGVLRLPVECRAEVFFLIEIENLKNKKEGSGISGEDLERIGDRVDSRTGLWVIVRDGAKRRKIKRHLSTFDPEAFQ